MLARLLVQALTLPQVLMQTAPMSLAVLLLSRGKGARNRPSSQPIRGIMTVIRIVLAMPGMIGGIEMAREIGREADMLQEIAIELEKEIDLIADDEE